MNTIYAKPAAPGRVFLEEAPPGLVGTITMRVVEPAVDPLPDVVVIAETASGISEVETGDTSTYWKPVVFPPLGSYLLVWNLGDDQEQAFELEVSDDPPAGAAYLPTIEAVAVKVLARTRDRAGNAGTFTDKTPVTADQVERMIQTVSLHVAGRVGASLDPELVPLAKDTVAAGVAAQIERSLAPESVSSANSAYAEHQQAYKDGLETLEDTVTTDPGDTQDYGSVELTSPTLAAERRVRELYDLPPL